CYSLTKWRRAASDSLTQTFLPQAAASLLDTSLSEIRVRLDKPPDLRMSDNASLRFLSAPSFQPFIASSILFNHLLQIIRHFGQRLQSDFHRSMRRFGNDCVYLGKMLVFVGIIFAKLCTATFFPLDCGSGDRLGYSK